jgi:hypothetical protein
VLSNRIKLFIGEEKLKTYDKLGIKPRFEDLCFYLDNHTKCYYRAYVEDYDEEDDKYDIVLLDFARLARGTSDVLYPFKHENLFDLKYKALKCTFTTDKNFKLTQAARDHFERLIQNEIKYCVQDTISSNNWLKCLLVKVKTNSGDDLSNILQDHMNNNSITKSPGAKNNQKTNQSSNAQSSSVSKISNSHIYDYDQSDSARLYNIRRGKINRFYSSFYLLLS